MTVAVAVLTFEGDLGTFLASREDAGPVTVTHGCVEPASVKDVIESHGVPHPEVDGILVDGRWAGFSHKIRGGETIRVFPYELRALIPEPARLVPSPPDPVGFVLDGHLGTLARRLRLCGFDSLWSPDPKDADLAALSAGESRVLLTRDVGLLKRRQVELAHKVRALDPFEQTVEVLRRYDLGSAMAPFSRCLACNGHTVPVEKEEVLHRLEPGTRREHDRFRRCENCGRLYWRGTHYRRLVLLVEELRAALRDQPAGS